MGDVFVLGNAGMDLSLSLSRLPHPGETLVGGNGHRAPGGKGLNQAVVAARAGARVHFHAPIGDDAEADRVAAALAVEGFASLRLPRLDMPTDLSFIMVGADGENSIVSLGDCADALTVADAIAYVTLAAPGDFLLMQGNHAEAVTLAAARATAAGVVLNAAPVRWSFDAILPSCAILVVNRIEAASLFRTDDPTRAAREARARGCETAIVTLGRDGCLWADASGIATMPAPDVQAVDTTGAGDTFCGALVACLAKGENLSAAIASAQRAAALCVARPGCFASLPTRDELLRDYRATVIPSGRHNPSGRP